MKRKSITNVFKVQSLIRSSNTKRDKPRVALKPGRRRTKNPHTHNGRIIRKSTVYYERRANRADINGKSSSRSKKPKMLLGGWL